MNPLRAKELVIDIPDRGDGQPLDFTVEPGQMWGVLGPNGAGKTTLLHTLAGLRAPRPGSVCLGEHSLTALRRRRISQQLGLVFQERQDGFPATVLETALIGRHPWLSPWQMESGDDERFARQALDQLDVGHLSDRLVNTLSGGERQRVAIATELVDRAAEPVEALRQPLERRGRAVHAVVADVGLRREAELLPPRAHLLAHRARLRLLGVRRAEHLPAKDSSAREPS